MQALESCNAEILSLKKSLGERDNALTAANAAKACLQAEIAGLRRALAVRMDASVAGFLLALQVADCRAQAEAALAAAAATGSGAPAAAPALGESGGSVSEGGSPSSSGILWATILAVLEQLRPLPLEEALSAAQAAAADSLHPELPPQAGEEGPAVGEEDGEDVGRALAKLNRDLTAATKALAAALSSLARSGEDLSAAKAEAELAAVEAAEAKAALALAESRCRLELADVRAWSWCSGKRVARFLISAPLCYFTRSKQMSLSCLLSGLFLFTVSSIRP